MSGIRLILSQIVLFWEIFLSSEQLAVKSSVWPENQVGVCKTEPDLRMVIALCCAGAEDAQQKTCGPD